MEDETFHLEDDEPEEETPDFEDAEAPHGRRPDGQPRQQALNMDRVPGTNAALVNEGIGRGNPGEGARARAEMRRTMVADLLLQNLTQREIALRLNISASTVGQDVVILKRRWRTAQLGAIEDLVAREAALLDRRLQAMAPRAFDGSIDHDKQLTQIAVRKAKLLGLDKAANIDVTLKTAEENSLESKLQWMHDNLAAGKGVQTGWGQGVDLRDAAAEPEPDPEDETEETETPFGHPNTDEDFSR